MQSHAIEKESVIPRYAQLKDILRAWIHEKCRAGDRIPSERELTQRFAISRFTVVRAVHELEHEGLLYSDHGRGTFVTAVPGMEGAAKQARQAAIRVVMPFSVILEDQDKDVFVHKSEYRGIRMACESGNINMSVHDASGPGNGAELVAGLKGGAVIFVGNWDNSARKTIPKLRSRGIPWCGIGGNLEEVFRENCIYSDLAGGARLALDHLVQLGHKSIGYCYDAECVSDPRLLVFRRFVAAHIIPAHEYLPVRLARGMGPVQIKRCAYKAALARIARGALPGAFFCQNDLLALGILDAAKEKGLRVPGDLAIMGFDDRPESAESEPALATVKTPFEEMGREAVRQMKLRLQGGRKMSFPPIRLPCKLLKRESCGRQNERK